jgi:polyhydroxyalkanoate synthesis regulator phasin
MNSQQDPGMNCGSRLRVLILKALIVAAITITSTAQSEGDSDGDRINDKDEMRIGTNPNAKDSDGDGSSDYDELLFNIDPTDPEEKIVSIEVVDKKSYTTEVFRVATISKKGEISKTEPISRPIMIELSDMFYELERKQSNKKIYANLLEQRRSKSEREAKERQLDELEKKASDLQAIYLKDPTLRNEGAWSEAYGKALQLQWELYPSSRPVSSSNSTIEDLEEKIEDLERTIERSKR